MTNQQLLRAGHVNLAETIAQSEYCPVGGHVKTRNSRASAFALITVLLLTWSIAHANERILVGLAYFPASVVSVTASVPVVTSHDVTHSVRTGVSYAFTGLPAVNAAYVLSGPREDRVLTYIGAGVGLAFPAAPAVSSSFSGHALAGVNVVITHSLSGFAEVVVAGNSFGTRMSFGAGVSYAVGGSR